MLRVVSCNVNSLSPQQDYVQWKAAAYALQNIEADVIALQETNLAWNKAHRCRIRQIFHQAASAAVISTANSAEINTDNHQRGGTMQAIVSNWTPHTVSVGTNKSGLGRWSFIKVQGQSDQRFIFLSGYRVCKNQQVDFGSQNTYNQQYRLLHQQGHRAPDPQSQFIDDLISLVNNWRTQNKAVLICIDANENPQIQTTTGIHQIFEETELINLHSHRHPGQHRPPTYNRGSTPIDVCAGSIEFADALEAAWYLPFGKPIGLKGNHHTLGVDFNTTKLFQQRVSPLFQLQQCGVNSNNQKLTQKFCKEAMKACQDANIFNHINLLTARDKLTIQERNDIKSLDCKITTILTNADKKCIKQGTHPWSPELHTTYLIHYYWSLKLSHKQTGRNY